MKVKCIIVDDEPLAIEAIEMHLNELNDFEISSKCSNAIEAFEVLKKKQIDLIFLDIQMPKMTGLDFLRTLKNPPLVIITSAYSEFALDGYELDVVDYLLKPVSFERFMQAIEKYYRFKHEPLVVSGVDGSEIKNENFIYVKADRKVHKLFFDEILFLESMKDYVKIHLTSGSIITKNPIINFEEKLPESMFIRIHRSFIINKTKVKNFTASSVNVAGKELIIAQNYSKKVLADLGYFEKLI